MWPTDGNDPPIGTPFYLIISRENGEIIHTWTYAGHSRPGSKRPEFIPELSKKVDATFEPVTFRHWRDVKGWGYDADSMFTRSFVKRFLPPDKQRYDEARHSWRENIDAVPILGPAILVETSQEFEEASRQPDAESIQFRYCPTADDVQRLARFRSLKRLAVISFPDAGTWWKGLGDLQTLTNLTLECFIPDELCEEIAGLNLQSLRVWQSSVSDAGLRSLTQLKELKLFDCHQTLISDVGLQAVCSATRLQWLDAGNTRVRFASDFDWQTALADVRFLNISQLDLGPQSKLSLPQFEKLGILRARGITGLHQMISGIENNDGLVELSVANSGVSIEYLERLHTLQPQCSISCELWDSNRMWLF